jgi:hypothetical protein
MKWHNALNSSVVVGYEEIRDKVGTLIELARDGNIMQINWVSRGNRIHHANINIQGEEYGKEIRGAEKSFLGRYRQYVPHYDVQTGSGAHPTYYPMGTRDSLPGGKAAGA